MKHGSFNVDSLGAMRIVLVVCFMLSCLFAMALNSYGDEKYELMTPDGDEYVDLGLPSGTLWATCNIGANSPEEYGDYFAWGETEPKEVYSDDNYKWPNHSKYNDTDNKTELEPEDDVAYVYLDTLWRIPSDKQFCELFNFCTWLWTQMNGVNGYLVTGPNGNIIFLPAAGVHFYDLLRDEGTNGYYWTRSRYPGDISLPGFWYTVHLEFDSDKQYTCCRLGYRTCGHTVRAVRASIKDHERGNPERQSEDTIYKGVEQMPQFPGGLEALMRYIKSNIRYVPLADNVEGCIIVQFVVDEKGKVGETRVLSSLTKELDDELVRVVKTLPNFTPGHMGQKAVSVWYTLPVTFKPGVEVCVPDRGLLDENGIYRSAERMPSFPGGEEALMKYIETHIQYPPEAAKNSIQGRVIVQFVVNEVGKVGIIKVVRSVDKNLDIEAIRVVKSLPNFTPGLMDRKPVSVWYTLPVTFKL